MIGFVAVKSLGGYNYVRPDQVIAVAGLANAFFFGEDQARYVVTASADNAPAILAAAAKAGVAAARIGTTGGDALALPGETPVTIAALRQAHETWLPRYMDGPGGELG